jgi:hypothetical protein
MAEWNAIYEGIRAAFAADAGIVSRAGSRWYSDQLPDRRELPAIRWALITNLPHQTLSSGENITADVQIDVYADRDQAAACSAIGADVVRLLDRKSITASGFASMRVMCTSRPTPFKEEPYFRLRSVFRFVGVAA